MPKLPETEGYYKVTQIIERRRVPQRDDPPGRGEWRQEDVVLAQTTAKVQEADLSRSIREVVWPYASRGGQA